MIHRFLVHSLSQTFLVVDITRFGIAADVNSQSTQTAPVFTFVSWKEAEAYFRTNEADQETIARTRANLSKNGVAVMTIL